VFDVGKHRVERLAGSDMDADRDVQVDPEHADICQANQQHAQSRRALFRQGSRFCWHQKPSESQAPRTHTVPKSEQPVTFGP